MFLLDCDFRSGMVAMIIIKEKRAEIQRANVSEQKSKQKWIFSHLLKWCVIERFDKEREVNFE